MARNVERWTIEELPVADRAGIRFVVTAPGCPLENHVPNDCDCAAFEDERSALRYVRSGRGRTRIDFLRPQIAI